MPGGTPGPRAVYLRSHEGENVLEGWRVVELMNIYPECPCGMSHSATDVD